MPVSTGLGLASSCDPRLAGKLAAGRALEGVEAPQVALLFSSTRLDQDAVLAGVREAVGALPVFGGTCHHQVTNLGVTRGCVAVMVIGGGALDFHLTSVVADPDQAACADDLAARVAALGLDPGRSRAGLLLGTEEHRRGARYAEAFSRVLSPQVPMVGGGTLGPAREDSWSLAQSSQFCGQERFEDRYSLLVAEAAEGQARFAFSFASCWSAVAPPVRVTRAEGKRVFEVDHTPILEYARTYLGGDFQSSLEATSFKYTFLARLPDGDQDRHVIMTPEWRDADEAVPFFPDLDLEGAELQLVQLSRAEMLDGATRAAEQALAALDGFQPAAAVMVSCNLRQYFLHSRTNHEVARVREVLGDHVPLVGMYAGGEFAPMYARPEEACDPARALSGTRGLSTSVCLLLVGVPPGQAPGKDLSPILRTQLRDDGDRECSPADFERRIAELVRLLDGAEGMIDETEAAFKHINREHFLLAEKLKKKNRELAVANRRGERLQKIIRQYTPHNVWQKAHLSVDAGYYSIPDEELTPTLMFLDVKGFTSFAEGHTSAEVIREINKIFEPATAIVYDHGGDVDKYIGDCIFATFPEPLEALEAALEIQALARLARGQGSPFSLRIGIHRGRVVSGNVGGTMRRDNTLIGDAVNLAQRLEANCSPGNILLSGEVFRELRDDFPGDLEVRRREVQAKGKAKPVEAYEVEPP